MKTRPDAVHDTCSDPSNIRRREYRAIAFLLVFGMVIWMVESFLSYAVISEDDFLRPVGSYLQAHAMFIPIIGIVCFMGYGIYITKILVDVRRAEQGLQESEERYRLLTHNSLTGIYIQQNSVLVYVNDRFAHILGYLPAELVGRKLWDFVHPDDRPLVEDREIARSLGKEVVPQYEFRVIGSNGNVQWVEVLAATVMHLGVHSCMGNLADVTERKKHEAERESLISDLQTAREALHFQATHDALTRLLNRSAVLDALSREVARAAREDRALTVIMADLDDFKTVNDTYGHLAGDAVLQEVARRVRSLVRSYDLVGRYGGEEFLVALPGCDFAGANHFAERVRRAIGDTHVQTSEGIIPVTLSLGVNCVRGPHMPDLDGIIREADQALYKAKRAGRNCAIMASHAASPAGPERAAEESERTPA